MRSSEGPASCGCLCLFLRGSAVTGDEGKGAAGAQLRIMEILAQRALSSVICSQKGQSDPSSVASVWAWPRQKMHASCTSETLLKRHLRLLSGSHVGNGE